ncbi:MAG: peptidase S16, partial [Burkholderiales bacterium]
MSSVLTLQSLPLFPLGTVLYPGGILPLRIFEVRYLDMIGRCHKAGAPFGVVSLTQGSEVRQPGGKEAFSSVGTLATIS